MDAESPEEELLDLLCCHRSEAWFSTVYPCECVNIFSISMIHEFQISFHVNSWNGNWMKDTGYIIVVNSCSGKRWPFSLVKPTGVSDEKEIGGHCQRTWWPGFCGCSYSWFYTPCPWMDSVTTKTFTIDALPRNHCHWSGITGVHFFRLTRLQCGSWPCSETFDCSRWKDFQETGATNF